MEGTLVFRIPRKKICDDIKPNFKSVLVFLFFSVVKLSIVARNEAILFSRVIYSRIRDVSRVSVIYEFRIFLRLNLVVRRESQRRHAGDEEDEEKKGEK